MAIRRGDAKGGVEGLQDSLEKLHAMPYELLSTPFKIGLVQGLLKLGRSAEAMQLADETIRSSSANGDVCYLAELLRVKGSLLLTMPEPSRDDAEACFLQSLELSRRQGARAWELRTTVDLATIWADQGRTKSARGLLRPLFDTFEAGSDTADLRAAERLLAELA